MHRVIWRWLPLCAVLLLPVESAAQFTQYTVPGSGAQEQESRKEPLEQAVDNARWRLGPLKVDPWISVRDFSYIDNVLAANGEEVDDFTSSGGAGLRAYLRSGPKVIWALHALPEYTWWKDLEERRQWNGRYGVGAFAYFNRLTIEVTATRSELQQIATAEFEERVTIEQDSLEFDTELELSSAFSLYLRGGLNDNTYDTEDTGAPGRLFGQLDREETVLGGGISYSPRDSLTLSLGAQETEAEFQPGPGDRSSTGSAVVLGIDYDGPRIALEASLARRSIDPEAGSQFPAYDDTTGTFLFRIGEDRRIETQFYGSRNLAYSATPDYPYFIDDRLGLGVTTSLRRRLTLSAFAETGSLDFVPIDPTVQDRSDDLTSFGARLGFELRPKLGLQIGFASNDYDSNVPGLDRTVTSLISSITFGGASSAWY